VIVVKPVAFVIPWYGDDISGGAESECNQLAHLLAEAGIPVEVLTTCVRQASDDRGVNTLPEGLRQESGIPVRRFPVKPQNIARLAPANQKLYLSQPVTLEEERAYLEEDINSPAMYAYIRENRDAYHCFIFLPYLYGVPFFGSMECPGKAVMMPCLHDEGYAHMAMMKDRMNHLDKMIFLSKPECELAESLYGLDKVKKQVVGAYVESGWESSLDPDLFRRKYDLPGPFLLCAGRKDPGKKTDLLLQYFLRYLDRKPGGLKLVFIGGGRLEIPASAKEDVLDLGFVSPEDKHNAMAACLALCNPSFFESFSIVIMESWLAQRPALVSEQCRVTANFCLESNGGLWFDSYEVFEGCVDYLLAHPREAEIMGRNGSRYVRENFTKEVILRKLVSFLDLPVT
jgi:glycosyltransferase involved in cell wall biosynthesis